MSEMVERVARALAESDGSCWDGIIGGRKVSRDKYRSLARDAIAALREPTEGMCEAGKAHSDVSASCAQWVWFDMIDEALK